MSKNMQGKTVECLRHFLNALATSNNGKHVSFFLKYMGVAKSVAENWNQGKNQPKGLNLIKAALYLKERGYKVEDLSSEPEILRLGRVLAQGWMLPEEAATAIGYANGYDLYRIIMGSRKASSTVMANIAITNALYRSRLAAPFPIMKTEPKKEEPKAGTDLLALANLISACGNLGLGLKPSLEKFFQKSNPGERQNLRDAILKQGGRNLFEVSNSVFQIGEILNALCTERALNDQKNKKG
jgi:hypothetical protein